MTNEKNTDNWYMTEINDYGMTVSKSTDNSASWSRLWRKIKPTILFRETNITNPGTQVGLSNSYADFTYILVHFGRFYNGAFYLSKTMLIPTIVINGLANQFNMDVCSNVYDNNTDAIQFGFTSSNIITVSSVQITQNEPGVTYILAMQCFGID